MFDFTKILLGSIFISGALYAEVGTLSRVIDGDTIKLGSKTIRLYGIDTPESKLNKRASRKINKCVGLTTSHMLKAGKLASNELSKLLKPGKKYKYEIIDTDRYGRLVANVFIDNRATVNNLLVFNGYAVPYYKYIKSRDERKIYKKLSSSAKKNNRGLYKSYSSVMNCLSK